MSNAIQPRTPADELDRAVDEAISLSSGDLRAAIRGLILGQRSLEDEFSGKVSAGYVRRRTH